jgi:hypothetical protein
MKAPHFSRALLAAACGFAAASSAPTASAQSDASDAGSDAATDNDVAAASSLLLSAQAFWAQGKVMPGVAFGARLGFVELDLEASLVWLTEPAPPRGITFLGSEFGAHIMLLALRHRHVDLAVGLGGDLYWLGNVHGDALEAALALKSAANVWITPDLGLYATARAYPIASSGLELGTHRAGDASLPVLFSTGITWSS